MKATMNILTKYRVIPIDLLNRFQVLINKTNLKKDARSNNSGGKGVYVFCYWSHIVDIVVEFSIDEIDDTPFTQEENNTREANYVKELAPFLYNQMDMVLPAEGEGKAVHYLHHYDDNIRASANFQPPRVCLCSVRF